MIPKISAGQAIRPYFPKYIPSLPAKKKEVLPAEGEKSFADVLREAREKKRIV